VVLIATIHPWWTTATPVPAFTLESLTVAFTGSGASAVHATSVCAGHCPVRLSVGERQTLVFTVTPTTHITNCSPSPYYTVTNVVETSSGGAFGLVNVSANSGASLPVNIPSPLGGPTCVTTAQIWVTFGVADQGPSNQTPALKVTVTQS